MNEIFTLRQSSMAIEAKVERCGLGIHDITDGHQVVEMSAKIYRRNKQGRWLECDFGKMMFHDSQGNIHEGFYNEGWWRAQVPMKEPMEGVEYWPYELNEGSMQYVHTCKTKRMYIAVPERQLKLDEPILVPTLVEKEVIKEKVEFDYNREMEKILDEPVIEEDEELPLPPKSIDAILLTKEGAGVETKEEVFQCPICGITMTKTGKPFKSWRSVKTHSKSAHKVKLINEKDRIKCCE